MSEVSELVRRRGRAGRHRVSLASTPPSSATSATSTWASQSTRCAAAVSAVAQRATAFLAGRRGPTTSSSSSSRGGIGSSAAAPAPLALVAASGTAAAAAAARSVGGLAAVPGRCRSQPNRRSERRQATLRRRQGGRVALIGCVEAAGGRGRCCAGVRPRATLARGRTGSASALCPVRDVSCITFVSRSGVRSLRHENGVS